MKITRMWANAQRDGRHAEYGWSPLFNAAKFGWRPLLECRRCQDAKTVEINPKLTKRSQPLVGRSSPYCKDMGKVLLFNRVFPIVDTCLSCEDMARQICAMVRRWRIFGDFLCPGFPASHVHHIPDLHSKFALGPTPYVEVWLTSNLRPLRLGEEKSKEERKKASKKDRKKETRQKYNVRICYAGQP